MRVLAFDPGTTTGYCVIDKDFVIICGQLDWKELPERVPILCEATKPELVVVERPVFRGLLNSDKTEQIRAFDRVIVAVREWNLEAEILELIPEVRRYHAPVPKRIKGNHARDAFRLAVAGLRKKGVNVVVAGDA